MFSVPTLITLNAGTSNRVARYIAMAEIQFDYYKMGQIMKGLKAGHISYLLGAKAKLSRSPDRIRAIDCSGFVRYVIYKTSASNKKIADGSFQQQKWFEKNGYKKTSYSSVASKIDGIVRIAFKKAIKEKITNSETGKEEWRVKERGHVWFIINGKTFESRGRVGPSSLPWKNRESDADFGCFILGPLVVSKLFSEPLELHNSLEVDEHSITKFIFNTRPKYCKEHDKSPPSATYPDIGSANKTKWTPYLIPFGTRLA